MSLPPLAQLMSSVALWCGFQGRRPAGGGLKAEWYSQFHKLKRKHPTKTDAAIKGMLGPMPLSQTQMAVATPKNAAPEPPDEAAATTTTTTTATTSKASSAASTTAHDWVAEELRPFCFVAEHSSVVRT